MTNSILPPEFHGLIYIGGRRGLGKTFLASTIENPALVTFLDYEEKGEGIHRQLDFGQYHSIATDAPTDIFHHTLRIIESLKQDAYTTLILDNISPLEQAMKAEATKDPNKYAKEFGLNAGNIATGRFGGASAVVNHLISAKLSRLVHSKGISLIIATAHAKPFWASGGPVPNKWNILGADQWQNLSILTLLLVNGDHAPVPSALVKKEQLGSIVFDGKDFIIQRRLPYRLPEATSTSIKEYLKTPANLSTPEKGETPSKEELSAYGDELTAEQMTMNMAALEVQMAEIKKQEEIEEALKNEEFKEVKAMILSIKDKPLPIIMAEVSSKYDGYDLGQISSILKG